MKVKKTFDCIAMKRRIQERIYAETRDMGPEELAEYFRKRIAASRFAYVLEQDAATVGREGAR